MKHPISPQENKKIEEQAFICRHGTVVVDGLCAVCGEEMTPPPIQEWEKKFRETFEVEYRQDKVEVDVYEIITFIRKTLASQRAMVVEEIENTLKEKSAKLPIDIERQGGLYAQGMHAGIDLGINVCIDALKENL